MSKMGVKYGRKEKGYLGVFAGVDILGWGTKTSTWTDLSKALAPVSKHFETVKGEITKIDGQKVTIKKDDS